LVAVRGILLVGIVSRGHAQRSADRLIAAGPAAGAFIDSGIRDGRNGFSKTYVARQAK
jgi:hypothetical protein